MSAKSVAAQFSHEQSPVSVEGVNGGRYVVTVKESGVQVEVQRAWDGRGWHVFEWLPGGYTGEYMQSYRTLTDAVEAAAA